MVFDLVRKERYLNNTSNYKHSYEKYLMWLFKFIGIALFITLECFIYLSLNKKIDEYSDYGIFDFLVFFLFIIFIISIINSLFISRKLLFNRLDNEVILPLPISSGEIIYSKLFYLYFNEVLLNLCISTPLLICFGATNTLIPYFYVFSIIYPFLISLLIIGISLTFVVPFEYLYNFLKKHDLVQFVISSILVILLCFIYKYLLDFFLASLNDSSFGGVLSSELVNALHKVVTYLVPLNNIFIAIINKENVMSAWLIFFGLILVFGLIGINLSTYFYNKMNKLDFYQIKENKKNNRDLKVYNINKALIKKEFTLLFKDSSYIFSYTALLIMMPFLSYIVISSLNAIIYDNLRVFSSLFPELTNGLSLTLILLFIGVINANASLSISRENKCIEIIKYIPVKPIKQIIFKLIAPISLSSISLIISLIILVSTGVINYYIFIVSLIIGLVMIIFSNVGGVLIDMHDRLSNIKHKLSYLNNLFSLGFPFIILLIHFLLSFIKAPVWAIYLIISILSLVILIPLFININKRIEKLFRLMEVNI